MLDHKLKSTDMPVILTPNIVQMHFLQLKVNSRCFDKLLVCDNLHMN